MADFTSVDLDSGFTTSAPDGLATTATSAAPSIPTSVWYGGAQITFVMRARIISTTTYIYWNILNQTDPTGTFSGHAPLSDLVDIAVHARIVR